MTDLLTQARPDTRVPPSEPKRTWRDHSLVQLTLVRYREFFREPEAVFWVLIFPIALATGLGIAFRHRPPERVAVGILANQAGAAEASRALTTDSLISVKSQPDDSSAARALRVGTIALLVIPQGPGRVEYRYDETRPEARTARQQVDNALQRAAGRRDPLAVNETQVHERGSRYIDFLIPGLLGMNLMGSGIWGIVFTIVDARKKKLLKRLVATPMSRAEYLMSFLLSRLTMLTVEVVTLLGFGALAFHVPFRGSLWQLGVIALLSALAFSAIGLLISTRARTMEGASGLTNLVMLPMWVFSGVFFSSANFPASVQPFIKALPLTAAIDAMRANMLQGAGLSAVAPEIGIATAWLVVCFAAALRFFRWR